MFFPSLNCSQVFELIPLLGFIPVDKDVDLWTFVALTDDPYS